MIFKEHLNELRTFLKEHQSKWTLEIINHFPKSLDAYEPSWIEFLDTLDDETLWRIDCNKDITEIEEIRDAPFYEYSKKIKELTTIYSKDLPEMELPLWAWDRVKLKKKHEISKLAPYLKELCVKNNYDHAVDIGGGKGHLSRVLAHYLGLPTISIDQNRELQDLGEKRLNKFPKPEGAKDVRFVPITFGKDKKDLVNIFTQNALTVGLHTCGPLTNLHIKHSIENETKSLLNFGCCYIKLGDNDINISDFAKSDPLPFNKFSLTLATRGHNEMSLKDFKTKERVKYFRYGLHLLMTEKLSIEEFVTAGNTPLRVYWGEFSDYVLFKLKELEIEHELTKDEIQSFYEQEEIQKRLRLMFLANIIRWQLGRVIEHYILTDRCLYLEERGFQANMYEVFDSKISPRNIAIEATRK